MPSKIDMEAAVVEKGAQVMCNRYGYKCPLLQQLLLEHEAMPCRASRRVQEAAGSML